MDSVGVFFYDRIDQAIAAFRDLRKSQTDKGTQDKCKNQTGKYAFEMDGVVKAADMGKAVIIKDAQRSADGSRQNQWKYQQVGGRRHGREYKDTFLPNTYRVTIVADTAEAMGRKKEAEEKL